MGCTVRGTGAFIFTCIVPGRCLLLVHAQTLTNQPKSDQLKKHLGMHIFQPFPIFPTWPSIFHQLVPVPPASPEQAEAGRCLGWVYRAHGCGATGEQGEKPPANAVGGGKLLWRKMSWSSCPCCPHWALLIPVHQRTISDGTPCMGSIISSHFCSEPFPDWKYGAFKWILKSLPSHKKRQAVRCSHPGQPSV